MNSEIAKTLLTQSDNLEIGVNTWKFTTISKMKNAIKVDENNENYGILSRAIGYNDYLSTIMEDSKKYPYWTMSDEVKEEMRNLVYNLFPKCEKNYINFYVGSGKKDKQFTMITIDKISVDILNVLSGYDLKVNMEEIDDLGSVHASILRQYSLQRNINTMEEMHKLNNFLMKYSKELFAITELNSYVNKLHDILDLYDEKMKK